MTNSRNIQGVIIAVFALVISVWLGVSVVTNQTGTILNVAAIILFLFGAFLGQRIWLLLIFFVAVDVPLIRGLGTEQLGQIMFIGFCTLLFMMRKLNLKWKFDELDFWRVVILIVIAQVYFRNPVGLNIFGSGAVGARPYFNATLTLFAGFILSKFSVRPNEIKWAVNLSLAGSLVSGPLAALRGTGGGPGGLEGTQQVGAGLDGQNAGRLQHLRPFVYGASQFLVSRISPLKAIFHPFWAPILFITLVAAAATGFRNVVAHIGFIYLVGIAYRGGLPSLLISATSGAFCLGALAIINLVYPLPPNIQRALSPFPGTWEEQYVQGAENSTEWRVEMWEDALLTDNWIQNKIWGDGLGLTRIEMQRLQSLESIANHTAVSGLSVQQEAMMITGNYHSGPVQSVRTVGYVGLLFLVIALIRLAVHAHRQIVRCRGTEWFSVAIFFGAPIIIFPTFFFFIFGTFDKGIAILYLGSGMISLLKNNLPLPEWSKNMHRIAPGPQGFRNHQQPKNDDQINPAEPS